MPQAPTLQPPTPQALAGVRICDFCGQLAGAGATKWLAAFGAEVIRIEDPVRQGRWDILRGIGPFVDERRGIEFGGGYNNHNVGKLGITLNLRTERGRELLAEIVRQSDCVTENFAAGVLERLGFGYERLKELRPAVIYVSNCGFGQVGPYAAFKTWGPIVQAVSGLTFASGLPTNLPGQPPAGWGYSYMDHTGGYYMAMAILLALIHRGRTGEGQWVDLACTESALTLHGPALLDWSVNGRPARLSGQPHSNRSAWPPMAPHGIYPCAGEDAWVAIACRDEADWRRLAAIIGTPWTDDLTFATLQSRLANQDALDAHVSGWTAARGKFEVQRLLREAAVPCSAVQTPQERVDQDPDTEGLWPTITHTAMGEVRVDGLPARFSATPWTMTRGAPCLGEHNEAVLGRLLGLTPAQVADLQAEGVI
ncbi:MAG TPA: CoA transferase [Caulobacteraceae bacterium]|nr:CoA transferase [Caulobacteraceae bacterium]